MTRDEVIKLLYEKMESQNLRRHCLAVEAVMGALYRRLNKKDKSDESEQNWKLAGLLHDADYGIVKDDVKRHTHLTLEWLEDFDVDRQVKDAILAHGWKYVPGNPEPKNNMEWSIYCCDELTGFIVAVALTRPNKTLAEVKLESMKKKWKEKSFAGGVDRSQVGLCEEKLGIPLDGFMEIALKAMQDIHKELGL